jgi:alpha,alpha-trehalase
VLSDAIMAETAATGLHPSGRWQRSPTDDRIDAALLIPAIRRGVPADDLRTIATWAQQGDMVRATRWFERNRTVCGTPGLICEEYDVAQRQLRGNIPRAFVHAALLQCAATLALH